MYSLIRLYAKRWEAFKQQVHLLLKILKSHKIDCRFSRLFYCPCGQQANVSHAGGGQHSLFDKHKPTLTSTLNAKLEMYHCKAQMNLPLWMDCLFTVICKYVATPAPVLWKPVWPEHTIYAWRSN